MTIKKLADNMSFLVGGVALALMLGALGIQFIGRYEPCEICHWQRWPLYGAIFLGLVGGYVARQQSAQVKQAVITGTILLVALSGAIGVYHAGIEWMWWPGPTHCTGNLYVLGAPVDPNAYKVVPCDKPALFIPAGWGLSLAAWNALISLGTALVAAVIVRKAK